VRRNRNERGVALVEFALVLPFLAIIVFGTVDLGRSYRFTNRLRNAAREGAQLAQFNPEKCTTANSADPFNINYKVLNEDGLSTLNPTVTILKNGTPYWTTGQTSCPAANTFAAGDEITVRVEADFRVLTPLISNLVGSPLRLTGSQDVDLQR
jgi:Flp pilus assembly protein TadG